MNVSLFAAVLHTSSPWHKALKPFRRARFYEGVHRQRMQSD